MDRVNPSVVCRAAVQGDDFAKHIIKKIVDNISLEILQLALILDPQLIALGGDICKLPSVHELFVEPIIENVRKSIPFSSNVVIGLSALGEHAGVIGASFFAIESLLTGEFPYALDYEIFSQLKAVQ